MDKHLTLKKEERRKTMSTSQGPENGAGLQHISLKDIPVEQLNPFLDRQFVTGQRSMLARIILRKGCQVPLHSHHNEQISYVLEGALMFFIDGKEVVVAGGEVLVIPAHMPHSVEALEDTVDLDIFSPPRADWLEGTDAYLRG
jgi:quercetin dioxygenase-like cupin family protein